MSHDRGCFKCGDDLPPRSTGCELHYCPYRPKPQIKGIVKMDKTTEPDLTEDSGDRFLDVLQEIADEDVTGLKMAQASYGNSWKSRGGVGAFMMLARKWDRLENRVKRVAGTMNLSRAGRDNVTFGPYDIFGHVIMDQRAEGVIDDIRDLRRYLTLVEAELRARGFGATHRDNK